MVLLLLFSFLLLTTEAEHCCSGTDCPICALLILCKKIIVGLGLPTGALPVYRALLGATLKNGCPAVLCCAVPTLTALHVKLSD